MNWRSVFLLLLVVGAVSARWFYKPDIAQPDDGIATANDDGGGGCAACRNGRVKREDCAGEGEGCDSDGECCGGATCSGNGFCEP